MVQLRAENYHHTPQPSCGESLLKKYDIPISHLDYSYVRTCSDAKHLERIIRVLLSGEEGYYPDLLNFTRKRLEALKPNSRLLRQNVPALRSCDLTQDERTTVNADIQEWIQSVHKHDEELSTSEKSCAPENGVSIRKVQVLQCKTTSAKAKRIKSTDYESWDRFDPDTEIMKMELEEERIREEKQKFEDAKKAKIQELKTFETPTNLTSAEKCLAATQQKERGNEYFRTGDYENALDHYNKSLAYKETHVVYNNRAITHIKLNQFKEALSDCNKVIEADEYNAKAYIRKAQALRSLGKFNEALECLEHLISFDPNNKIAQSTIGAFRKGAGSNKVRLMIKDECARTAKVKVIMPIPGTSQAEPPFYQEIEVSCEKAKAILASTRPQLRSCKTIIDLNGFTHEKQVSVLQDKVKNIKLQSSETAVRQLEQKEHRKVQIAEVPQMLTAQKETIITKKPETLRRINEHKHEKQPTTGKKNQDPGASGEPHHWCNLITNALSSPYEFIKLWQFVRNDASLESQACILRRLNPSILSTVVSCKLDEPMLGGLLRCLERHFTVPKDINLVGRYLTELSRLPRFDIAAMFLEETGKTALRNVMSFLGQHGYQLPEDVRSRLLQHV